MGENRSVCMRWGGSWCVYAMGRIVVCVCDAWDGTVAAVAAAVKSRQEAAASWLFGSEHPAGLVELSARGSWPMW